MLFTIFHCFRFQHFFSSGISHFLMVSVCSHFSNRVCNFFTTVLVFVCFYFSFFSVYCSFMMLRLFVHFCLFFFFFRRIALCLRSLADFTFTSRFCSASLAALLLPPFLSINLLFVLLLVTTDSIVDPRTRTLAWMLAACVL